MRKGPRRLQQKELGSVRAAHRKFHHGNAQKATTGQEIIWHRGTSKSMLATAGPVNAKPQREDWAFWPLHRGDQSLRITADEECR